MYDVDLYEWLFVPYTTKDYSRFNPHNAEIMETKGL